MALQQSEATLLSRVAMMDKLAIGQNTEKAGEILSLFSAVTAQLHKDTLAGDQEKIAQSEEAARKFIEKLEAMMSANFPKEIKNVGRDIFHAIEQDSELKKLFS